MHSDFNGLCLFTVNILLFSVAWLVAMKAKDLSKIDIFWAPSFALIALLSSNFASGINTIVFSIVAIWALRLTVYLFIRNSRMKEDKRYIRLQENWSGSFYLNSYFRVFFLQSLLASFISLPFLYLKDISSSKYLAILVVSFIAIIFESIADLQKYRFKSDVLNVGKVFKGGLWRFSRHPNYFAEIVFWWCITLFIALNTHTYWILISPLFLNVLILKVSGPPMLEEDKKNNLEYQEYIKTTNRLIPMPRRQI